MLGLFCSVALLSALATSFPHDAKLVAHYTFDGDSTTSFPDHAGGQAAQADPAHCTQVDLFGNKTFFAAQLSGNASQFALRDAALSPLQIPHSSAIDASSYTLAFWVDWWWGDSVLWSRKDWLDYLMLYNTGYLKYELHPEDGSKIEDGPYPRGCGYLEPGSWSHVALAFDGSSGELSVYTNGSLCYSSRGGKGGVQSKDGLSAGAWSGLLAR